MNAIQARKNAAFGKKSLKLLECSDKPRYNCKEKCRMRQKLSGVIYENSERLLFKQTDQQKR